MIWFLGDIQARIEAVSLEGRTGNGRAMREHERVIGILPDELKRLLVLVGEAWEKKKRIDAETIDPCTATEDGPNHFTRSFRADQEHRMLVTCFWESVQQSVPGAEGVSLNIVEGWQVVTSSPKVQISTLMTVRQPSRSQREIGTEEGSIFGPDPIY